MVVYRLARTKYANDLSGEGSRLHGGRWNHIGVPCIYSSVSKALAVLEYTVNTNIHDIPRRLSMISIEIPDDGIEIIPVGRLPGNWTLAPAPDETKNFGTRLLKPPAHLVIQMPSVVIPDEFNYLLNPMHLRAAEFRIIEIKDFVYDLRMRSV
jgi:RES domain-containing protein